MFLDPRERTTAISVWIMSFSLGGAIGPIIGGLMLEYFWWGSVFLISVPVMLLLLVLGPVLLPEYRDPNAGKLDLVSAALSLTAVLTVIYGLKRIAQDGVDVAAVASIVSGVVTGAAFVRRQRRLADPLIDLWLFRIPDFRASLVMYGGSILCLFGGTLFFPQYLQLVLGLSPMRGALWMLPWAMGFVVGSLATPPLARHIRPAPLMSWGLVLSSLGYFLIARLGTTSHVLPTFAIATAILSLGASPLFTLTNDIIIGSAPPERAGAASGISETCAELGGALSIAIFGSIGVAIYRGLLAGALPAGLSPDVSETAMSTLGGAVAISGQLSAPAAAALIDAARDAFVRGLVICAVIGGGGSVLLALFAASKFSRLGVAPQRTAEHPVELTA
jgi:DHA2 family multidrug resistance protein-like MFS transporter